VTVHVFGPALPACGQLPHRLHAGRVGSSRGWRNHGLVRNQGGAAAPGATVTVTNVETNRQRVAISSAEGVYAAPSLAPGDYRIDVELSGFRPVRREGIRLSTGEKTRIDFELAVGDVREQVTVTGDASVLRIETASLGTVVEHEQVVQLPLNGRSFITLASLSPGVALPPIPAAAHQRRRPRTNEYLFDGISVLQPEPGQVAFFPSSTPSRSSRSRATVRPRIRAVQRRRHQSDDQGRHQCVPRQWLRVLSQRSVEREELLPVLRSNSIAR